MQNWKKSLLVLVVVGLVCYWILMPASPQIVSFHKVCRGAIAAYIEEEGKTQLRLEQKIFPTMSGFLGPITLEVGDRVRQGQLITRIDDVEIRKEIEAVEAEIKGIESQCLGIDQSKPKKDEFAKARLLIEQSQEQLKISEKELSILQASFAQTEREFVRISRLFAQKIATAQEQENIETRRDIEKQTLEKQKQMVKTMQTSIAIAEANLAILHDSDDDQEYLRQVYKSQVEARQTRLVILKNNLRRTDIVSPFDGVVLERVTTGNVYLSFVMPDYYLLKVGDLSTLEVRVDILSDDIRKVKVNQTVEIYGAALGSQKLQGKVAQIYPSAFTKISSLGIEQQRVTVLVHFENIQKLLNPGYRVDVKIFTHTVPSTLLVPTRAIFLLERKPYLFAVVAGKARLRQIKTGIDTDETSEILAGVVEGDTIVIDPPNALKDGDSVGELLKD